MDIKALLEKMTKAGASDLHLKVGSPPFMRLDGELVPIEGDSLRPEDTEEIARFLMPPHWGGNIPVIGSLDFSYAIPGCARFRVNLFHQRGTVSLVLRVVRFEILDFETLDLPEAVPKLAKLERGLVLVTGVTGSGKSTTLAAILNWINQNRKKHIVTIEDPIEFLYRDSSCIINQQELGIDFENFEDAIKRALRQDPDIILVGEMRDRETIRAAITASETGHLVFSTLHTADAMQTVDRILKYFDAEEQELILSQLAMNLKGVVSQRLLVRSGGKGRVPAVEILIGTPIVSKLISEGRTSDLKSAMRNGEAGMITFDQSMVRLVKSGIVDQEEALLYVDSPVTFMRNLKGGYSDGDRGGLISF